MTLFSRLFTKTPPPRTLDGRIAAAAVQSESSDADSVLADREEALRFAAIGQLQFGDELLALAGLDRSEPTHAVPSSAQRLAQQRLVQLIETHAFEFDRLCVKGADATALLSVAALSGQPAHIETAINFINDVEFLCALACAGPTAKLRQLAAEHIHDPEHLRRVLRDVRGKDKNVYKIIKTKCDLLHAQEKRAAQTQADISAVCDSLQRLTHKPFDALFVPTLEHLDTQWQTLTAEAPPELQVRATQAIEACRDIVTKHVQLLARQAAEAAAIASAEPQRHAVLNELRSIIAHLYSIEAIAPSELNDYIDRVTAQRARCIERWIDTTRYQAADPADTITLDRLTTAVSGLLHLIAHAGTLQQQTTAFEQAATETDLAARSRDLKEMLVASQWLIDAKPAQVDTAVRLLQEWTTARADKEAAAAAALRNIGGLIRKASGAIKDGRSRQAAGIRRAIEEKIAAMQPLPTHLSVQLQQLDEKLDELQDWKNYAVAPKRVQLIESMEALIGSKENPDRLADHIKRLQEEWKALTKGSGERSEADWERFHQAAQAAYQPCREHFAAQAQIRHDNLELRKALLAKLRDFNSAQNWEDPDWKEIARALRLARQEWQRHTPVDRASNKPIQESFDALMHTAQSRLDAEYARNIEHKKALISQAKQLIDAQESRKAIDEMKRLQLAWREVGIVPHFQEQPLWEEFKQQCDGIYENSRRQYTAFVSELEDHKIKALDLCAAAERLAGLTGPQILEGLKQLPQLREEFAAVGELPKDSTHALNNRFQRALKQLEANAAQQHTLDRERSWSDFLEAGNQIRLQRLATIENAAAAQLQASARATREFIDGVTQWPKGGLQAIQHELTRAASTDIALNETALRTLCIRAEILTDTATPSEDQSLRRNYQVQRLVQTMGQGTQADPQQMTALTFEWITVGATPTPIYLQLLDRFNQCRSKARRLFS